MASQINPVSEVGKATLVLAESNPNFGISWHQACHLGANSATLKSLTAKGYLHRTDYPDSSKFWFITNLGRAFLKGEDPEELALMDRLGKETHTLTNRGTGWYLVIKRKRYAPDDAVRMPDDLIDKLTRAGRLTLTENGRRVDATLAQPQQEHKSEAEPARTAEATTEAA